MSHMIFRKNLPLFLFLLLSALLVGCSGGKRSFHRYYYEQSVGYMNSRGKIVVEPVFDALSESFSEGYATAVINDKAGYIDARGRIAIPLEYDKAFPFSEGLAAVQKAGKFGFISSKGEIKIPFDFDKVGPFQEGVAPVVNGEKMYYIDKKGERSITLPAGFTFETALIGNLLGRPVTIPLNDEDILFHGGLAVVKSKKSGKFGYMNNKGLIVIEPEFHYAAPFSEGLAAVSYDGKTMGYLNPTGELVIPAKYDLAGKFSGGLAPVYQNERGGYLNKRGKVTIKIEFDGVGSFQDGLAPVQIGDRFGFINKRGKIVIGVDYLLVGEFRGGLAPVLTVEEKLFYINKKGKKITPR